MMMGMGMVGQTGKIEFRYKNQSDAGKKKHSIIFRRHLLAFASYEPASRLKRSRSEFSPCMPPTLPPQENFNYIPVCSPSTSALSSTSSPALAAPTRR